MTQLLYTIVVVLDLPKTIAALIAYAKAIVLKMTNNAYFPTPSPNLAAVTAAITAFESVESSMATTKGPGLDKSTDQRCFLRGRMT